MNDRLRNALKKLRLSGLSQSLEVRLHEAASHNLNHLEFLELILQDELLVRSDRLLQRRVQAAAFRELRTLDQFIKQKDVPDEPDEGPAKSRLAWKKIAPPGIPPARPRTRCSEGTRATACGALRRQTRIEASELQ